MICAFCGKSFDAAEAEAACRGCALFGGCRKVRCPHCGAEAPAEAPPLRWLRKLKERLHGPRKR